MAGSLKPFEAKRSPNDMMEVNNENVAEIANAIATLKQPDDEANHQVNTEKTDEKLGAEENVVKSDDPDKTKILSFMGTGSYKFESSEHVDEYLKNLGVGLVFRKVQSAANPTMTIYPSRMGDEWAIKMDSIFRTREVKFRFGEEFTDETFDGRPCQSTATLEGPHRLAMIQRCTMGPDVQVVYEFKPNSTMQVFLTCGPHTANLSYHSDL